jgi:hypothetical protein
MSNHSNDPRALAPHSFEWFGRQHVINPDREVAYRTAFDGVGLAMPCLRVDRGAGPLGRQDAVMAGQLKVHEAGKWAGSHPCRLDHVLSSLPAAIGGAL